MSECGRHLWIDLENEDDGSTIRYQCLHCGVGQSVEYVRLERALRDRDSKKEELANLENSYRLLERFVLSILLSEVEPRSAVIAGKQYYSKDFSHKGTPS